MQEIRSNVLPERNEQFLIFNILKMKKTQLSLSDFAKSKTLLSRDERKKIMGGYVDPGCKVTEQATTSHSCDGPDPNDPCGIDKDKEGGGVCCIDC